MLDLAIGLACLLLAEREVERVEQCLALLVVLRRRGDSDVHAAHRINLFVLDFRKDDLFGDAEIEIAAAVEAARRAAAEVADTWQCDGDQALQALVHILATQRHLEIGRASWWARGLQDV